jgi:hypothetical protein
MVLLSIESVSVEKFGDIWADVKTFEWSIIFLDTIETDGTLRAVATVGRDETVWDVEIVG